MLVMCGKLHGFFQRQAEAELGFKLVVKSENLQTGKTTLLRWLLDCCFRCLAKGVIYFCTAQLYSAQLSPAQPSTVQPAGKFNLPSAIIQFGLT